MRKTKNRLVVKLLPALLATAGAIIGLALIGLVAQETQSMMIIAPFGATAILLFSLPHSPSSRTFVVFLAYLLATVVGLGVLYFTPLDWFCIALGFGVVLFVMQLFDIVHPPAGAHFIVVTQTKFTLAMAEPLFVGLLALLIFGFLFKKADLILIRR